MLAPSFRGILKFSPEVYSGRKAFSRIHSFQVEMLALAQTHDRFLKFEGEHSQAQRLRVFFADHLLRLFDCQTEDLNRTSLSHQFDRFRKHLCCHLFPWLVIQWNPFQFLCALALYFRTIVDFLLSRT